jgi:hypothetical protein
MTRIGAIPSSPRAATVPALTRAASPGPETAIQVTTTAAKRPM